MAFRNLKGIVILLFTFFATFSVQSPAGASDANDSKQLGGRIINGVLASLNDTKHQVSIRRRSSDQFYFGSGHICGGSLIEPNVVLSAAHCFMNQELKNGTYRSISDFIIVAGTLNRYQRTENTLTFDIMQIVYGIKIFNTSTYENDIAVVFLNASVPEQHPTIEAIQIARTPVAVGTVCQATGWGRTERGILASDLLSVDLPIIDLDTCRNDSELGEGNIRDGMICAGYMNGERDACDGDSGGPLVCNKLLTGIVSWGIGCALPHLPGVYTDVAYWSNWVDNTLASNGIVNNGTSSGNSTNAGGNNTGPGNNSGSGNSTGSGIGGGGGGGGSGGGAMSNFTHSAVLLAMVVVWTTLMSYFD